jgi:hypothetical protein
MNLIKWLEKWYQQNCDGEWEHFYGIEIGTLDNPGWYVKIDLKGTQYENLHMLEMKRYQGTNNWIRCMISDGIFEGTGDCKKLDDIILIFKETIENA